MSATKTYDPSKQVVRDRVDDLALQRRAAINARPLAVHLTKFATYLGIGALTHAWLIGAEFDNGSLWSWGYVLAWPIPLGFWLLATIGIFALYGLGLFILCAALWWGFVAYTDWRDREDAAWERLRNRPTQPPRRF
ncbi:hypothetical protein [Methylorubrum populi]|uniref:hypothetical protein n=1 Tax=Methylorubrum populi TaxID=223967 RepID=UPI0023545AB5|nr:hypothetical protein [Methylorubrum populi]